MGWLEDRIKQWHRNPPVTSDIRQMKGFSPFAVEKGRFKTPEGISGKPERGTYSPRLNPAANLKIPPPETPTATMGQKIGQALNSMGQAFGGKAYGYGQDKASNMKIRPEVPTQDLTRGLPKDMAERMGGYVEGARERSDRIGSKRRVGVEHGEGGKMISNWWGGFKDRLNQKSLEPTSPLYPGKSERTLESVPDDGSDNVSKKPESEKNVNPTSPDQVRMNEPSGKIKEMTGQSDALSKLIETRRGGAAAETAVMEGIRDKTRTRENPQGDSPYIEEIRGTPIPRQQFGGPWKRGKNGLSYQEPMGKQMSPLELAKYYAENPTRQHYTNPQTMSRYGTKLEAALGVGKQVTDEEMAKRTAIELEGAKAKGDVAVQAERNKGLKSVAEEATQRALELEQMAGSDQMPQMETIDPDQVQEISTEDMKTRIAAQQQKVLAAGANLSREEKAALWDKFFQAQGPEFTRQYQRWQNRE